VTTELQVAHLCHRVPGRARIRFPNRRGDRRFFADLTERLAACEGITRIEANPLTGSVLLLHAGALEPILEQARRRRLFALAPSEGPPIGDLIFQEFQGISEGLRSASGGQTDLGGLVFILLLIGAVVQLARGVVWAPAMTLLWYAASVLLLSQSQASDDSSAGRSADRGSPRDHLDRSTDQ
jgi:hypothetical protein